MRNSSLSEKLLTAALRSLPIKHGAHRLLDIIRPHCSPSLSTRASMNYHGHQLMMDIDDLVGWHFYILGHFDPEVSETLIRYASTTTNVFWDIGANKGACSYAMATALPTCKIVSIEPQATLTSLLQLNLKILAPDRHEIYNVGIGDVAGTQQLVIPTDNRGQASLINHQPSKADRIESIRIATAQEIETQSCFGWPTLVKIDVEGYEPKVIKSILPAFSNSHIRCCVFECHPSKQNEFSTILKLIQPYDYEVFAIHKTPFNTYLTRVENLSKKSTDYAIIRTDCIR